MNVLSIKHFTHLKEIKMFVRACGNMVALDFPLQEATLGSFLKMTLLQQRNQCPTAEVFFTPTNATYLTSLAALKTRK